MLKHFLKNQISKVLNEFDRELVNRNQQYPLDLHLRTFFKQHKSIGSKDRKLISENVYQLVRNQIYLDTISPKPLSWDGKIETMLSQRFHTMKANKSLLPLFDLMSKAYGEQDALTYLQNINNRAPLTVRVNPYKISRDDLLEKWNKIDKLPCKKTSYSPYGIVFTSSISQNLFDLPEFKRGYFEIQDEASQLAALTVKCQPGQKILDFCCGAAGKSLAFAPYTKGTGKIYLHDVREKIFIEAKKRLKRAGVINVEFLKDKSEMKKLKGRCDWVVVDAPCSGTGTLRRNPDLKNKFKLENLQYYTDLQRSILEESLKYVKKDGGKLVYITCSLLPQENLFQVQKFCEDKGLEIEDGKHFQTLPVDKNGMDSLFAATLQYPTSQQNENEQKN
ncbi:hypothetical protein PPERSA_11351 [Pseudocohnilembus persalinus]|uniref:SAM-dependent MTase RsmB/NOP-type domain-containing protein n=1 Tax=Pseudocohnilembus persalinus TaxID=266149 RepID=A0A0V0QPA6_PSEPJ|nr:hypothetical protein PPERSA_11351 [Pseudocohnilembus persalinus]|eukprot:KRX04227.1 hypothetical protein PPERSA_11351 [Pseudocohnilembus persalinus]